MKTTWLATTILLFNILLCGEAISEEPPSPIKINTGDYNCTDGTTISLIDQERYRYKGKQEYYTWVPNTENYYYNTILLKWKTGSLSKNKASGGYQNYPGVKSVIHLLKNLLSGTDAVCTHVIQNK